MNLWRSFVVALALLVMAGMTVPVGAIVTEDVALSESNPTNATAYAEFDWSYVYRVGADSGVAVDPYWVLISEHQDSNNLNIEMNSDTWTAVEHIAHPTADLRLVRYNKPLPGYYPLYEGGFPTTATPQKLTGLLVGYGVTGIVLSATSYEFTANDASQGTRRWGDSLIDNTGTDGDIGDYIQLNFDTGATDFAAGSATRDSGGGVFVYSDNTWKLAGTTVANTANAEGEINSTVAVALPSYNDWITGIIPEPSTAGSLLAGLAALLVLRSRRRAAGE